MPKTKESPFQYFAVNGPWGSDSDKAARAEAEACYEQFKGNCPYVALIESHHVYSQGYWIEFVEKEIKDPDLLLKCHINPEWLTHANKHKVQRLC